MKKEKKEKKKRNAKKLISGILTLVVAFFMFYIPQHLSATIGSDFSFAAEVFEKTPLYAAHRGLSALYPQNTVLAFEKAAQAGFYAFECDVHTTSDGHFVVIHNDTVDDMTDGSGEIEKMTLNEIRALTIDKGNGIEDNPGLKVPTLEETLAICDKYDIIPVIELKKLDTKYLPDLIKALENHGLIDKAILISFNFDYLTAVKELNKNVELMYLVKLLSKKTVDKCIENGNIGIDFKYSNYLINASALKYAKDNGLKLVAWTVDNTFVSDIMFAAGAYMITTNRIVPVAAEN